MEMSRALFFEHGDPHIVLLKFVEEKILRRSAEEIF